MLRSCLVFMPVGPLSMLIQGALAMAVSALTRSTCLGVLAVFVPFAGWTMYFYASYPVWFNLWAMSVDFPTPSGPTIPTMMPLGISTDKPSSATTLP